MYIYIEKINKNKKEKKKKRKEINWTKNEELKCSKYINILLELNIQDSINFLVKNSIIYFSPKKWEE